jgi:lysine/ornithine N-monooxygenase
MNLYKNSILLYGLLKDNINLINYVNKKTYTIVNIIHTNMSLINACFLNLFFRPKDSSIINTTRLSKTAFHPYNHYFSYFYYSLNEDIINKKGANYSQLKTKKYFKIYQGLYVEIYKDQ